MIHIVLVSLLFILTSVMAQTVRPGGTFERMDSKIFQTEPPELEKSISEKVTQNAIVCLDDKVQLKSIPDLHQTLQKYLIIDLFQTADNPVPSSKCSENELGLKAAVACLMGETEVKQELAVFVTHPKVMTYLKEKHKLENKEAQDMLLAIEQWLNLNETEWKALREKWHLHQEKQHE